MGCQFPAICKVVARRVGKHLFPTTPCAGAVAVLGGIPRLLRSGVLVLSPYATKMGVSLLLAKAAGKDKTAVWRWQERFMREGIQGLTRDKTRPSRIAPLPAETVDRVVALTNQVPPHEACHRSAPAMAKAVGVSPSSVRRIWAGQGLQPHRVM
jgi:hypothetical protein